MKKGEKMTNEQKIKISLSKIGKISPKKGIKLSDEQKSKLNLSGLTLGRLWNKGTKGLSKKNSGSIKKGNIPWNKGKTGLHSSKKGKKFPNFSGENHPNWQGGITPINFKIRNSTEYKLWRESVFYRDNWTCVWCGITGGKLQADHIKQFATILESNNIKTIEEAIDCQELWNINNGRTLCKKCHKKVTSKQLLNNKFALGKNIKKISLVLLLLLILPTTSYAQLNLKQGGTGTTTVQSGWLLMGLNSLRLTEIASTTWGFITGNNTWTGTNTLATTTIADLFLPNILSSFLATDDLGNVVSTTSPISLIWTDNGTMITPTNSPRDISANLDKTTTWGQYNADSDGQWYVGVSNPAQGFGVGVPMLTGYDSAGLGGALFLSNSLDLYDNAGDDQVEVRAWQNLGSGIGYTSFYNTPSTGYWTFSNLADTGSLDVDGTMALGNNASVDANMVLNIDGTHGSTGDVYGINEGALILNPGDGNNAYFNYFGGNSIIDPAETIANTYGVYIGAISQTGGTSGKGYGLYVNRPNTGAFDAQYTAYFDPRVGIGTTTPSNPLSIVTDQPTDEDRWLIGLTNTNTGTSNFAHINMVSGASASSTEVGKVGTEYTQVDGHAGFGFLKSNGAGVYIAAWDSAGIIKFLTGGQTEDKERMRITADGLVGIGTTNPADLLDIRGSTNPSIYVKSTTAGDSSSLVLGNNTITNRLFSESSSGTTFASGNTPYSLGLVTNGNDIILRTASDSVEDIKLMVKANTGNVGIGTTTPLAKLDVAGTLGSTADLFNVSSTTATNVVSSVFKIFATGITWIGTTLNHTTFEADGTLVMEGDATVFDDVRVPLSMGAKGGVKDPGFDQFSPTSTSMAYAFDGGSTEEELFFTNQIPHGYKLQSVIQPHIHLSPIDNNSGVVVFKLQCDWADQSTKYASTSVEYATTTISANTALYHYWTDFSSTTPIKFNSISGIVNCRISRTPTGLDTYPSDIFAHEVDFHYEISQIGSRTIRDK